MFAERIKIHKGWKDAEATLTKKREAKVKLELANKTDKIPQATAECTEVSSLLVFFKSGCLSNSGWQIFLQGFWWRCHCWVISVKNKQSSYTCILRYTCTCTCTLWCLCSFDWRLFWYIHTTSMQLALTCLWEPLAQGQNWKSIFHMGTCFMP